MSWISTANKVICYELHFVTEEYLEDYIIQWTNTIVKVLYSPGWTKKKNLITIIEQKKT